MNGKDHKRSSIGEKRLAAIVFTDVVGFTGLVQEHEALTLRLVRRDLQMITRVCHALGGAVLKRTGDGLLMSFTSAASAVTCAVRVQKTLAEAEKTLPGDQLLRHRIGIHLGDVWVVEGSDVIGNGVNVAARILQEAEGGGICLSQTVYDVVKHRLGVKAVHLGARELKNIRDAIHVYRLLLRAEEIERYGAAAEGEEGGPPLDARARRRRWLLAAAAGAICLVGVILAVAVPVMQQAYRAQVATPSAPPAPPAAPAPPVVPATLPTGEGPSQPATVVETTPSEIEPRETAPATAAAALPAPATKPTIVAVPRVTEAVTPEAVADDPSAVTTPPSPPASTVPSVSAVAVPTTSESPPRQGEVVAVADRDVPAPAASRPAPPEVAVSISMPQPAWNDPLFGAEAPAKDANRKAKRPARTARPSYLTPPNLAVVKPIFDDEFVDNRNRFRLDKNPKAEVLTDFGDGRYIMTLPYSGFRWIGVPCKDNHSFACEVIGRVAEGSPDDAWVLMVYPGPDTVPALAFEINGKGVFNIKAYEAEGQPLHFRFNPIDHPAIKRKGEFNGLLVVVKDGQLQAFINQRAAMPPGKIHPSLVPSNVGFGVTSAAGKTRVEFERMRVWLGRDIPER